MYVLVDIGNTRVKLGLVDTNSRTRLPLTLACPHTDLSPIGTWLSQHLTQPVTGAIGVNVASEALAAQVQAVLHAHGIPAIHWQTGDTPYQHLYNRYQHPERLGADRWVSAIGLQTHAPATAFLHVSFGTATTVDAIVPYDDDHEFKGGLILPGPQLMQHALSQNTARLGAEDGVLQDFPNHTAAAIHSGIAAAQAGAVVRQWLITHQATGHAPQVFCSGGGKPLVEDELHQSFARMRQLTALALPDPRWFDTPTLDGLAILTNHLA